MSQVGAGGPAYPGGNTRHFCGNRKPEKDFKTFSTLYDSYVRDTITPINISRVTFNITYERRTRSEYKFFLRKTVKQVQDSKTTEMRCIVKLGNIAQNMENTNQTSNQTLNDQQIKK